MPRIMGIDYGTKKCGISVTDPLQIIVTGLDTEETKSLKSFLGKYLKAEAVEKIVFGRTTHPDGNSVYFQKEIDELSNWLQNKFPDLIIDYHEEAHTSKRAKSLMHEMQWKRTKRRDKKLVDKISAILILQEYLGHI